MFKELVLLLSKIQVTLTAKGHPYFMSKIVVKFLNIIQKNLG